MGMWKCQICGSNNREKDDYETWVQIICDDCGAFHTYYLSDVIKVSEDGKESNFNWRKSR